MKRYAVKIDYWLLIAVVLFVFIGALAVYSASYYELEVSLRYEAHRFFKMNLIYSGIGLMIMLIVSFVPYELIKKFIYPIAIVTILAMLYVWFFGIELKGARRWIELGSVTFMPLELTKITLILVIAKVMDRVGRNIKNINTLGMTLLICFFFLGLALPEKDMATTVLMLAMVFLLLYVNGAKFKHLFLIALVGMIFALILLYSESYRTARVSIWLETLFDNQYEFSDDKRQIMNSIYAISSGELAGKGIGMSAFSKLRLPEAYSDFIFAVLVEETGFIGLLVILLLYAFLIYRIFKIAIECDDAFGYTIASGSGILIMLQVIINIGVTLAIFPTTGITLPFISKGGTSLVMLLLMVGVVLNISASNKERKFNLENRKELTR